MRRKLGYLRWGWLVLGIGGGLLLSGCNTRFSEPIGLSATAVPVNEVAPSLTYDEATGLPLNPPLILADTAFIVEGTLINALLAPADQPLFTVEAPSGQQYDIVSQPLAEIFVVDGSRLPAHQIGRGLRVRATVRQSDAEALTGGPALSSTDFIILLEKE